MLLLFILSCTAYNFRQWQDDYGVSYGSNLERNTRKAIWELNVARHGSGALSPYTDLLPSERKVHFPQIEADLYSKSAEIKYPFKPFDNNYVENALKAGADWRSKNAVTAPKNQGPHGYCGTFARVSVAESQYHLRGPHPLTNFSVEQLVDCIGWANDQFPSFYKMGFEGWADYPFNISKYNDSQPPPCVFDGKKVIPHTTFTNFTTVPQSAGEDQMAAFVYKNGPVQVGINAENFLKIGKDHFLKKEDCDSEHSINHSINIVGFGTDDKHGDYWIIKNSWSSKWQDGGFAYVARGVNCGSITAAGASVFTYGNPADYYL